MLKLGNDCRNLGRFFLFIFLLRNVCVSAFVIIISSLSLSVLQQMWGETSQMKGLQHGMDPNQKKTPSSLSLSPPSMQTLFKENRLSPKVMGLDNTQQTKVQNAKGALKTCNNEGNWTVLLITRNRKWHEVQTQRGWKEFWMNNKKDEQNGRQTVGSNFFGIQCYDSRKGPCLYKEFVAFTRRKQKKDWNNDARKFGSVYFAGP